MGRPQGCPGAGGLGMLRRRKGGKSGAKSSCPQREIGEAEDLGVLEGAELMNGERLREQEVSR